MESQGVRLQRERNFIPVLIVGAGPAGLATAACLSAKAIPSLILEREDCSASLWKYKTYDRLHLHLPKRFCQLPLFPFPASYPKYPSRDQFVEYLDSYRDHFRISPLYNTNVTTVEFSAPLGLWLVTGEQRISNDDDQPWRVVRFLARSVVVATGENADPYMPSFFGEEKFSGEISHGMTYRSGAEYEGKKVLVVGTGNTGMEIALDLANFGAKPTLVARSKFHVMPRDLFGLNTFEVSQMLLKVFPRWFVDMILVFFSWLTLGSTDRYNLIRPAEGPLEMKERTGHTPVLDVGTVAKIRSGKIKVVPAIDQLTEDGALFVNGVEEDFDAIIMATGYKTSVPACLKEGDHEYPGVREGDCFSGFSDGFPEKHSPCIAWKGQHGLYAAGLSRKGLLGCAHDAVHVATYIAHLERKLGRNPGSQMVLPLSDDLEVV